MKARKAIQAHHGYDLDDLLIFSSQFSTRESDNTITPNSFLERLRKCSDIVSLFTYFDEHGVWDFLNCRLLSLLIKQFCPEDETLHTNMLRYTEEVQQFMRETNLCDFLDVWSSQGATAARFGCGKLKAKLNASYTTFTLEMLAKVRQYLCGQFLLKNFILRFEHAKSGCVVLYWSIPVEAAKQIKDVYKEKNPVLLDGGILGLAVDETVLYQVCPRQHTVTNVIVH